jgi:succinate dehydrogenase / fumarate reductase, flavoprotein subunit
LDGRHRAGDRSFTRDAAEATIADIAPPVRSRRPRGSENVRSLQRAVRNTMTEHAGVVRDEPSLRAGLAQLDDIEATAQDLGVHPDLAGFQDLAHAFDLRSSLIAARATIEAAIERRETRGCHNRSDFPNLDQSLQVNMVWSGPGKIVYEPVAETPMEIAALVREVSSAGKFVE